jgi:hypothetical protein
LSERFRATPPDRSDPIDPTDEFVHPGGITAKRANDSNAIHQSLLCSDTDPVRTVIPAGMTGTFTA